MKLPSAALATLLLLSACLAGPVPTPPREPDVAGNAPASLGGVPEGAIQVCATSDACDFWEDQHFHELTVYNVDTPIIDVIIVPPASPGVLDETRAFKNAVGEWARGVKELGAPWFAEGLRINAYTIGEDVVPPEALADPEIIVVGLQDNPPPGTTPFSGIGLSPDILCEAIEGTSATHAHDGMEIRAGNCPGVGFVCVAFNWPRIGTGSLNRFQDLVAHEVGHCLGPGHVGDALDFQAKFAPEQDIMSYQHDPDQVHCVSNLNVRVLEDVYAGLLGHPELDRLRAGQYYELPIADYMHIDCKNP